MANSAFPIRGLPAPGTSGNVLTSNGTAWGSSAAAAGGKLLQTVQTVDVTNRAVTSATFVSTGIAVTITPSAATSKVRITVTGVCGLSVTGVGTARFTLFRNAVDLTPSGVAEIMAAGQTSWDITCPFSIDFTDSPALDTAITYTLYAKGSGTLYVGRRGADTALDVSTIMTADEIGA